jgi:ribonuclease HI
MEEKSHLLFTDGSALGNPGEGGWGSVLVLSGNTEGKERRVIEMGGYEKYTTNNRMELFALIKGLERLENESGDLTVFTDSKYVHMGATSWADGWIKRGWKTLAKTDVENRDLWEMALPLLGDRKKFGKTSWTHVPGHSGIAGNERCDAIATGYAKGDEVGLFEGELGDYAIDILNIAVDAEKSEARSLARAHSRAKAYSYLSLVGGKAMRHLTWAECEKRVKGKSGVRYKKTLSPSDESEILRTWGASL